MSKIACRRHAVATAVTLLLAVPASAQNDPATLLAEFIHYTKIAKPELAAAFCQQLLQSSITDAQLAEVLSENRTLALRFEEAIGAAHNLADLEAIAGELERRITEGQLALARDPERIEKAITMLIGTQRMKLHGQRQLDAAGEYGVPRLTLVITEGKDERMRTAVGEVLVNIGRQSVAPLCAALPHLDNRNQRFVCTLLGRIQLPQAAPYLLELADTDVVAAATRESAMRAFRNVGGVKRNLSELYTDLGQQYFNEAESLVAYPFEQTNNIWSYDPLY